MVVGSHLSDPNVKRNLFKLAIPIIFAQMTVMLYNVVDRIFIGKMPDGSLAMAGIGLTMPVAMLISAFSVLIGNGGAPLAAIALGKSDEAKAEKILINSFMMLICISAILTTVFVVFCEPILRQFGASNETIYYASSYLRIYAMGTLFVQLTLGMNPFINTQGYTKIGMFSSIIGAITNVFLDFIFIIGLNMGIKGAALATILAQLMSCIWIIRFLTGKKTLIKFKLHKFKPDFLVIKEILFLGIAPFIMQSMESLIMISYNKQLSKFGGDMAIASLAVMNSFMLIISLPIVGLCQGAQPLLGYNYGAKKFNLVREVFKFQIFCCTVYTASLTLIILIAPDAFAKIFVDDLNLIAVISTASKIYLAGQFFTGAQIACQQSFIALGQAKRSMFIVILRKGILLLPFIYIFPLIFQSNQFHAILLAQPVADLISSLIAILSFKKFYKTVLFSNEKVTN